MGWRHAVFYLLSGFFVVHVAANNFKADSSFHRIHLECAIPGARIVTRSGYYAFPRP